MATITIVTVIDVVGALATESIKGNIYLMDTNKQNGSWGQGTENLRTVAEKGDKLVWTVQSLECEAYASIEDILIDPEYCEPKKETYEGTDVTYWVGTIKKDIKAIPYQTRFRLGTREEPMANPSSPFLVGKGYKAKDFSGL